MFGSVNLFDSISIVFCGSISTLIHVFGSVYLFDKSIFLFLWEYLNPHTSVWFGLFLTAYQFIFLCEYLNLRTCVWFGIFV